MANPITVSKLQVKSHGAPDEVSLLFAERDA